MFMSMHTMRMQPAQSKSTPFEVYAEGYKCICCWCVREKQDWLRKN